jgi:major membrane immunogen (membrane-anchored lipoprotein)
MSVKKSFSGALLFLSLLPLCCSSKEADLQDGYYTAEAAAFDEYGWKEFVTIFVNNAKITTVEYNAKNSSGFIKSWDMDYMRIMNRINETYPNEYTRFYGAQLIARQNPGNIDALTGATQSYKRFITLARAVIDRAMTGDTSVALIDTDAAGGPDSGE